MTGAVGAGAAPAGVAVDGKTLRGSRGPAVPAVRLLGALGHDLGLVLAELVLDGRVVTVDAAFAERPAAEAILEKGWPT